MRSRLSMRRSSPRVRALVYRLDFHKESTYATILDPEGECVTQKRMPTEEIPAFLRPKEGEKVAMEVSTSIAPLYRKLVEEGFTHRLLVKTS